MLATLVGFLVEVSANKKFRLLNQTDDHVNVKVLRDGHVTQVPRCDIVVGDIVLLETGEKVPADGIVIDSFNLRVDESSFTGEPSAWKNHDASAGSAEATYPVNLLLRASTVIEGSATIRIERVGDMTEYGKIYRDAQIDNNIKTPLTQQLDRLGRTIARGSYVMAGLLIFAASRLGVGRMGRGCFRFIRIIRRPKLLADPKTSRLSAFAWGNGGTRMQLVSLVKLATPS